MEKRQHGAPGAVIYGPSFLTDFDIFLFKQGNHFHLYEKLGSHAMTVDGVEGTIFAVWAPDAEYVAVISDVNDWNPESHPLTARLDQSGIWEGFIPGFGNGIHYKYHIRSRYQGYRADKGDPFAIHWEVSPKTASTTWDLAYVWNDEEWMKERRHHNRLTAPMTVYEVHLGSWRRSPDNPQLLLDYKTLAYQLADYVKEMGFTHIEFLPLMEHPLFASWGYQTTGYFAPSSRYGTPQDFMFLIDHLHRNGIGVILDWVPSHFPSDEFGLGYFDGTHLFEHADTRMGFHPDWKSFIFNYGRNEVRSFLISSAIFWLEKYHIDGLRIDAVASMLYLDYSRKHDEWIPNKYGGRENVSAIDFIKRLNEAVYEAYPDTQTVAEESTAWPMVTRPVYIGGLGFGFKWNMGWMHDTLSYFSKDPVYRKHHHNQLTFSIWYAFWENFLLPLSHDEVVHGKGSLIGKMPGDEWQKFANLRALFSYMYGHPGKKLLFMGDEIAQSREWNHEESLDWHLLQYPLHQGIQTLVKDLNRLHRSEPALHDLDFSQDGFEWVDTSDWEKSIVSFLRKSKNGADIILVVCNLTPIPRNDYRVGIPKGGVWQELLNSDAEIYGGGGLGNGGTVEGAPVKAHGHPYSLSLTLPPLAVLYLRNSSDQ